MIKIILGALIGISMLFIYSACIVSGKISRLEEQNEYKEDI